MTDTSSALFQQMRLTILLTAQNGVENSPFHAAYLQAWDDGVYPFLDDFVQFHKPHADEFPIHGDKVEYVFTKLCDHWESGAELTFYNLEDMLGIHGSAHSTGDYERHELLSICRYLFLHDRFSQSFWATLCRNGDCPSEAHGIHDPNVALYFS